MTYLDPSEYAEYGLDAQTPAALTAAASALIDAWCRRPTLAVAQYTERVRLARGRNSLRLSFLPLAAVAPATSPLVAGRGRYAAVRPGDGGPMSELVSDVAQAFALPGAWTSLDVAALDFDGGTGEVTLPAHPLGLGFNEVEITYTAGLAEIPSAVKHACAAIARNAQATPALTVRGATLDLMHLDYFADTLLDQDVRRLLAPYVAQKS
jgi:hypothetical protein